MVPGWGTGGGCVGGMFFNTVSTAQRVRSTQPLQRRFLSSPRQHGHHYLRHHLAITKGILSDAGRPSVCARVRGAATARGISIQCSLEIAFSVISCCPCVAGQSSCCRDCPCWATLHLGPATRSVTEWSGTAELDELASLGRWTATIAR